MFFIESRSLQDLFYCNVFLLKADHCKVLFYWKKVLERFFIARMSLQRDADDFKNANGDDENEKQTRKAQKTRKSGSLKLWVKKVWTHLTNSRDQLSHQI